MLCALYCYDNISVLVVTGMNELVQNLNIA